MHRESDMAVREQRRVDGLAGGRGRPKENSGSDTLSEPLLPQAAARAGDAPKVLTAAELPVYPQVDVAELLKGLTLEDKTVVAVREMASPAPVAPTAPAPKRDSRAETAVRNTE
jgi:hypothetical protein